MARVEVSETSQRRISRMIFAISRSTIVSGTDLFANLEKLSLFFSLLRMFQCDDVGRCPYRRGHSADAGTDRERPSQGCYVLVSGSLLPRKSAGGKSARCSTLH